MRPPLFSSTYSLKYSIATPSTELAAEYVPTEMVTALVSEVSEVSEVSVSLFAGVSFVPQPTSRAVIMHSARIRDNILFISGSLLSNVY